MARPNTVRFRPGADEGALISSYKFWGSLTSRRIVPEASCQAGIKARLSLIRIELQLVLGPCWMNNTE